MSETSTVYIDGRWRASHDGRTLPVMDPSDGSVFGELSRGGAPDVDDAVRAARRAFAGWARAAPVERGRILTRLGEGVSARVEELARIESRDVGKPLSQARRDMVACARYCEFYGGAADKLHGETLPYDAAYTVLALREPFGVTAHIIPWNYPVQIFGRSVVASLAAGNAVVVKPGEDACLSILALVDLAAEAGLPPGVLNVVTGTGAEAGAALAGHEGVDHVSFTGSPGTGTLVQRSAAAHNRSVTMELGGKSPQIVFEDADVETMLPTLYNAVIQNAGQTCSAGSRVLVQEGRFDQVVADLAGRFESTRLGAALDDPDCGPLISRAQAERVLAMVGGAEDDGLRVAARAAQASGEGGYFVRPQLFAPVDGEHPLSRQEIFGPVLVATPFRDEAHAVELANATEYGLIAGVWTADGARQMRVSRALRCGQVFVNCYGAGGGVELPFGGSKRSGFGREKGMEGIKGFTQIKTIVLHHG